MTKDLAAIIRVGVVLAGLILSAQYKAEARMTRIEMSIGDLRERMARPEGLFDGFTKTGSPNG